MNGEKAVTVQVIKATKEAITKHWPGQFSAQPVYLEINPKHNTLRAGYVPFPGGAVPMDVHNSILIRCYVDPEFTSVRKINELMRDVAPLADRIIKGHWADFNGMNYVGDLDEDAREAHNQMVLMVMDQGEVARMGRIELESLRWPETPWLIPSPSVGDIEN